LALAFHRHHCEKKALKKKKAKDKRVPILASCIAVFKVFILTLYVKTIMVEGTESLVSIKDKINNGCEILNGVLRE